MKQRKRQKRNMVGIGRFGALQNGFFRLLTGLVCISLFFTNLPLFAFATGMGVEGDATTMTILYAVVRNNLMHMETEGLSFSRDENNRIVLSTDEDSSSNLSINDLVNDISDTEIKEAFVSLRKAEGKWTSVSVSKTISNIAVDRGSTWNIENGVRYDGTSMTDNYSFGNLLLDYAHKNISASSKVKNSAILEDFNGVTAEMEAPEMLISTFQSRIEVLGGNNGYNGYPNATYKEKVNSEGKVSFADYTISHRIDSRTLFIGTMLIHADALNDVIYRAAVESQTTDNQPIMYYKSELDGGQWKDILGAEGIDDILSTGDAVDDAELDPYLISCVIGADGIPRSPVDNRVVNLFETQDPYRMRNLPELNPLYLMWDQTAQNSSSNGQAAYTWFVYWQFFSYDTPVDKSKYNITEEDFNTLFSIQKRNICFYNLMPTLGINFRNDPKAFMESVVSFAVAGTSHNKPEKLNPTVVPTDEINSSGHWFSFLDNWYFQAHNTMPIVAGALNWSDEKKFQAEYGLSDRYGQGYDRSAKWQELQQTIRDYIHWYIHIYSVHDDITDNADRQLANLWPVYLQMKQSANEEDRNRADVLIDILSKIDATRRAEIYNNLVFNEHNNFDLGPSLLHCYKLLQSGKDEWGFSFRYQWNNSDTFKPDEGLVSIVKEAITSCQESYNKYRSRSLSEGKTILTKAEYNLSQSIIDKGTTGQNINNDLLRLKLIYNIEDGVIENKPTELSMIGEYLGTADSEFETEVHGIAKEKYWELASEADANSTTLKNNLLDRKAEATSKAVQMQELITARAFRLNTTQGVAFINQRLDWAQGLLSGVRGDDPFGQYATEAINEHIKWLQDILAKIQKGSLFATDEEPEDQKEELIRNYETALDNGDLEGAEKAKTALEEADEDNGSGSATDDGTGGTGEPDDDTDGTDGTGGGTGGNPTPPGGTGGTDSGTGNTPNPPGDTDGTDGGTGGTDSEIDGMAEKIYDDILENIDDGNEEGVQNDILALGDLGATKELSELRKALNARGAGAGLMQTLSEAEKNAQKAPLVQGSGTGSGFAESDTTQGNGTGAVDTGTIGNSTGNGGASGRDRSGDTAGNGAGGQEGESGSASTASTGASDRNAGEDSGDDSDGSGNTGSGNGTGNDGGNAGSGGSSTDSAGNTDRNTGNSSGEDSDRSRDRESDDEALKEAAKSTASLSDRERERLSDLIESLFGSAFSDLPDDEKIAVLIGCVRYGNDRDNDALLNYANTLCDELVRENNPFMYHQYTGDESRMYISMAAIDRARSYTRFRYVRNGNKASLTRFGGNATSFVFQVGDDSIKRVDGKKETLSAEVVQQADAYIRGSSTKKYPYLAEEDAAGYLNITCEYVPESVWAALATESVNNRAQTFYDRLAEVFL
ncbi:MAG: hypothetical protein IJ679_05470 [Lachnospiraceae bacterium]|nr:hypothetical protein [Lachnospiraceae bacterium]